MKAKPILIQTATSLPLFHIVSQLHLILWLLKLERPLIIWILVTYCSVIKVLEFIEKLQLLKTNTQVTAIVYHYCLKSAILYLASKILVTWWVASRIVEGYWSWWYCCPSIPSQYWLKLKVWWLFSQAKWFQLIHAWPQDCIQQLDHDCCTADVNRKWPLYEQGKKNFHLNFIIINPYYLFLLPPWTSCHQYH